MRWDRWGSKLCASPSSLLDREIVYENDRSSFRPTNPPDFNGSSRRRPSTRHRLQTRLLAPRNHCDLVIRLVPVVWTWRPTVGSALRDFPGVIFVNTSFGQRSAEAGPSIARRFQGTTNAEKTHFISTRRGRR
jgi:hypothetical protein